MYDVSFSFDSDIIEAVQSTALNARAKLRRKMFNVVNSRAAKQVIAQLSAEPDSPDTPIRWTNARQRKIVMMKLRLAGMEHGYIRSHNLVRGWSMYLQDLANGVGIIGILNKKPYTDYVQGESQQGFLYKWPLARSVIRDNQQPMQEEVTNAWIESVTL